MKPEEPVVSDRKHTWDEIAEANKDVILKRRDEAVGFIRKQVEESKVPAIVSFSGGKDSLTVPVGQLQDVHVLELLVACEHYVVGGD